MQKIVNIAIDGPSGAGKSTVAKAFAKKYGYIYVDTGALYRALGLYAQRAGVLISDVSPIIGMLKDIDLKLMYQDGVQSVLMNGENVNGYIRTPQISMYASAVSALPEVRKYLLALQRDIAAHNNVIMDGRDIGTVILPNADVKIFLTASEYARAKRRYNELCEKGENVTLEEVLSDMAVRDSNDKNRKVSPAVPSPDAVIVDNSEDDIDRTIEKITIIAEDKLGHAL